ncbi:MAG: hypothetical protein U5M50_00025 [Sphingobium sp.]|nr:hypothetical protein [Sphingobium sp.]
MLLFSAAVALAGFDPLEVWGLIVMGGFGDAFAWQNTLQRAAPLILTGLAVALPAQAGRVIIGAEGALVLGGLAAAALGYLLVGDGAAWRGVAADGAGRHADRRPVDRHRRLAARKARGQRDHLQPAAGLHRHRAVQPVWRRCCAIRPA